MIIIELKDIIKRYVLAGHSTTVLKNINLRVAQGDMLAIVGASGSGKSTLMNIIGLLDQPDSGTYHLAGHSVGALSDNELAKLRNETIGFVFQQFNLLPRLNVMHNVALPLLYRGYSHAMAEPLVLSALGEVGMQAYTAHKPMQLSGGQQQRVAIARALVGKPQVILADEPTGALDSKTGAEVMDVFLSLHHQGRTILLITHDAQVANICPTQIALCDGAVLESRR